MFFEESEVIMPVLYTGICDLEILAVNPTMEQAKELGIFMTQEPVYKNDKGDVYVDIHLTKKDLGIITRKRFIVNSNVRVSSTGKKLYINDFGQSSWGDVSAYAWFSKEGLREAKTGEEELVKFFRAYFGIRSANKLTFRNFDAITKGDVSEIITTVDSNKLTKEGNPRRVKVLLGVRTVETEKGIRHYQDIYSKHFEPSWSVDTKFFERALSNSPFSSNYNNSFELTKFDFKAATTSSEKKEEDSFGGVFDDFTSPSSSEGIF